MSQKSSLPQPAQSVSGVLTADRSKPAGTCAVATPAPVPKPCQDQCRPACAYDWTWDRGYTLDGGNVIKRKCLDLKIRRVKSLSWCGIILQPDFIKTTTKKSNCLKAN